MNARGVSFPNHRTPRYLATQTAPWSRLSHTLPGLQCWLRLPPVPVPMRVIAGQFRSRPLRSLPGRRVRPTSDRLRETLFDVLTAGNPQALQGSVWFDLFAGTGAVGIEALSRGAAMLYFVEPSGRAAEVIRANLETLGIRQGFEILLQPSHQALAHFDSRQLRPEFIFLDPPYAMTKAYEQVLQFLGNSQLSERALIIAEHEKKFVPGQAFGWLRASRTLRQGDAALTFYRRC
jgi:16S rRNA (guanine966-N2)-methyltransferase